MYDVNCAAKILSGIKNQVIVKCDQRADHVFNVDGELIGLCHQHSDIFWEPDYLERDFVNWIKTLRKLP